VTKFADLTAGGMKVYLEADAGYKVMPPQFVKKQYFHAMTHWENGANSF